MELYEASNGGAKMEYRLAMSSGGIGGDGGGNERDDGGDDSGEGSLDFDVIVFCLDSKCCC